MDFNILEMRRCVAQITLQGVDDVTVDDSCSSETNITQSQLMLKARLGLLRVTVNLHRGGKSMFEAEIDNFRNQNVQVSCCRLSSFPR
jgi:hypothetical protein